MIRNIDISKAMTVKLENAFARLPKRPEFVAGVRRASKRKFALSPQETQLALKNALRYPRKRSWH